MEVAFLGNDASWKKPLRVPLGNTARPGWNDLEIAVTNLWPNRWIGDRACLRSSV